MGLTRPEWRGGLTHIATNVNGDGEAFYKDTMLEWLFGMNMTDAEIVKSAKSKILHEYPDANLSKYESRMHKKAVIDL